MRVTIDYTRASQPRKSALEGKSPEEVAAAKEKAAAAPPMEFATILLDGKGNSSSLAASSNVAVAQVATGMCEVSRHRPSDDQRSPFYDQVCSISLVPDTLVPEIVLSSPFCSFLLFLFQLLGPVP